MQEQQYSEEELFGIHLDEHYTCHTLISDEGNNIYLYDRIKDDQ